MALDFTAATTDKVAVGTGSSLTDLVPISILQLIYIDSFTGWGSSLGEFYSKPTSVGGAALQLFIRTNGTLVYWRIYATQALQKESATSVMTTGSWFAIAITQADTDNANCHLYAGSPPYSIAETSYAVNQSAIGGLVSDSGGTAVIGNFSNTDSYSPDAKIAFCGIWNKVLSLAQIQAQFRNLSRPVSNDPRLFMHLGIHGSGGVGTQQDWSGNANNGTITGATKADHAPLPIFPYSIISPQLTIIVGTTVWGHVTGVTEDNVRTFAVNWTGTGNVISSGDNEKLELDSGEYMVSEMVETGSETVTLLQNEYGSGDDVLMEYRHGATQSDCQSASWNTYSAPFASLGFVQIRMTSTL